MFNCLLKSKHISCVLLVLCILLNISIYAQNGNEVKGIVKDANGQPIAGASIVAENQKTQFSSGAQSDSAGVFRFVNLPAGGPYSFTVSYVGYETQTLSGYTIGDKSNISVIIKLESRTQSLDQVVVIGYGTQRKAEVSTAIAQVSGEGLKNQPVNNVTEALAGKMAGVQVAQGTGEPGASLSVKIRGLSTITAGNTPLYVVDGVPINGSQLNNINPNDIASIEVLKDAASAAIYGSRGSNGVVIITTKMGTRGKTIFNYNSYYGVQQVAKTIDMMDAYQYAEIARDSRNNTYADQMESINRRRAAAGQTPIAYSINDENGVRLANTNNTSTIIPSEILPYLNGQAGLTNTNWQDEIFRAAPMQSHSISASGGNDKVKFYSSLEYFDQDGIIINSNFKRYSGRFNLEGVEGIIKYGFNLSPSVVYRRMVSSDGTYTAGGIISSALHYSPIFPVYNADGTYSFAQNSWSSDTRTTLPNGSVTSGNGQTQAWNPVALAMLNKNNQDELKLIANAFVEAAIYRGIKYRMNFGVDLGSQRNDEFSPSTIPLSNTAGNPESEATGNSSTALRKNYVWEHTLNITKRLGAHSIEGLAGWTIQKYHSDANSVNATKGFISNQITTLNAGVVTNGSSSASEWSLASGLARVQYSYLSKYLLTAAMRADGSSRFGTNNKWGYFPSFSAGWRLSKEEFLRSVEQITELKIRASYGFTGNFNIPNYGALGELSYNGYVLGGTVPTVINGASPSSRPNPDLTWEKTEQLNIGIDGSFFRNALTLTLDLYNSNTDGLLLNVPVPLSTGFSTELRNIGKVNNKGIEITLGTQQNFGSVKWDATINYAKNINKVISLGPGNADIINTGGTNNTYFLTRVGYPIGSYYLPIVLGVFKSQNEIDSYPHYTDAATNYDLATSKPGDFKFLDADGDGVIDFTKDRVIIGSYMPKFTYGFNSTLAWRNLDLSFALQGVQGNKIINLARRYFFNAEGNMNNYAQVYTGRYIDEAHPGNGVNRVNRVSKGGNGTTSSWHVEDGSFLRLRNVNLGYNFSEKMLDRISFIKAARIYVALQNPVTWTKYSGYNPEVSDRSNATTSGEDYGVYPVSKTTAIGLNITF